MSTSNLTYPTKIVTREAQEALSCWSRRPYHLSPPPQFDLIHVTFGSAILPSNDGLMLNRQSNALQKEYSHIVESKRQNVAIKLKKSPLNLVMSSLFSKLNRELGMLDTLKRYSLKTKLHERETSDMTQGEKTSIHLLKTPCFKVAGLFKGFSPCPWGESSAVV